MNIQKHPHDEFFRLYFKRPELLASLLEFSLPSEVTAALDLTTLEVENGTHIDEHLREHLSDLAATVQLAVPAEGGSSSAKVYILVEHKSHRDPWALLQLLRYMVQVWSEQQKAQPTEPLVPIIPLVVYHGRSRTIGTSFAALFPADLPKELHDYIPRFASELLNLRSLPDAQIPEAPAPLSAALWAMKYARTKTEKTLAALERLAATVGKALVEDQGFDILKLYIVQSSPYEPSAFIDMLNRMLETAMLKEEAVGTAEKLVEQGKQEGLREGLRRGVDIGREEGRKEAREALFATARRMLDRGFETHEVEELTGLSKAEVLEIVKRSKE